MFRVKQVLGVAQYTPPENYFARIENATLEILGETSKLLTTVNHPQLRELTRQRCNPIADRHDYIVFVLSKDLGNFNQPNEKERLEFRFTLKEISQPSILEGVEKQLIITPIYTDTKVLQGTLERITTQNFYL